jgi:hypothetical protein
MKEIFSTFKTIFIKTIACLMILTVSCHKATTPVIELEYIKGFDEYTKEIFINKIADIKYFESKYYAVDIAIGSVFVFNDSFNLIGTLGKKGKGPQELITPGIIQITEENIFIADISGNFIDCYKRNNMEFSQRIHIPTDYRLPRKEFYADDAFNFSVIQRNEAGIGIGMFNANNNSVNPFSGFSCNDNKESLSICKISEDILAVVPEFSTIIDLFSISNHNWINSINLPLPEETLQSWQLKVTNGRTPIFTDAYPDFGYLYISFQDFANGRRGMAKVTIQDADIKDVAFYHFKERNGDDVICVNSSTVVTFAIGTSGIEVYRFPDI